MTAKKKMNKSARKIRSDVKKDMQKKGLVTPDKLAIRLKEFHDKLEAEERTSYTISEQYDYIRDILEA